MLAVACSHRVTTAAGPQRFYDWAWIIIDAGAAPAGQRSLLIRRNNTTGELAYYRCYAAAPVPLAELVRVAGRRWTVEESFQACKGLTGLDQHQVRRWVSWQRWTVLAMLAYAFLAVLAATEHGRQAPARRHDPADLQRNPPPAQRPGHPADPQHPPPPALVHLAANPPAPRQDQPLPKTHDSMKITIYDCRTNPPEG